MLAISSSGLDGCLDRIGTVQFCSAFFLSRTDSLTDRGFGRISGVKGACGLQETISRSDKPTARHRWGPSLLYRGLGYRSSRQVRVDIRVPYMNRRKPSPSRSSKCMAWLEFRASWQARFGWGQCNRRPEHPLPAAIVPGTETGAESLSTAACADGSEEYRVERLLSPSSVSIHANSAIPQHLLQTALPFRQRSCSYIQQVRQASMKT